MKSHEQHRRTLHSETAAPTIEADAGDIEA